MICRRDFLKLVSIGMILGISNPATAKTLDITISKKALNNDTLKLLPSGIKSLDEKIGGFSSGSLTIIAGRPATGKTFLAINIAKHVGKELSKTVAFFSLEMPKKQLAMRMLCLDAKVDTNVVRKGDISKDNWQKLSLSAEKIAKAPIFIDDSSNLTAMEIKSKAEKLKTEHGLSLIIVDYLQLLNNESNFTSTLDYSETTKSLKRLAQELEVPVIVLSQLPRWIDKRIPPIPELNDLGSLEQYADNVLFITKSKKNETAKIIIAKSQKGLKGNIDVIFTKE